MKSFEALPKLATMLEFQSEESAINCTTWGLRQLETYDRALTNSDFLNSTTRLTKT